MPLNQRGILSLFQRFIPISAFYPHFSVLSSFQRFIPSSAFYPHFSVLSSFQRFIPSSAFYPHFSVLSSFQRFIPTSVSVFSFSFRHSVIPTPQECVKHYSWEFLCLRCELIYAFLGSLGTYAFKFEHAALALDFKG